MSSQTREYRFLSPESAARFARMLRHPTEAEYGIQEEVYASDRIDQSNPSAPTLFEREYQLASVVRRQGTVVTTDAGERIVKNAALRAGAMFN